MVITILPNPTLTIKNKTFVYTFPMCVSVNKNDLWLVQLNFIMFRYVHNKTRLLLLQFKHLKIILWYP